MRHLLRIHWFDTIRGNWKKLRKSGDSIPLEWMKKVKWRSHIIAALVGAALTLPISWIIADSFHRESIQDQKKRLLENVILENNLNTTSSFYETYIDTLSDRFAGRPFKLLQVDNVRELYKNLFLFKNSDSVVYEEFEAWVVRIKFLIVHFNQRIEIRNSFITRDPSNVKVFNPGAFSFYQTRVMPNLVNFSKFIRLNESRLIQ